MARVHAYIRGSRPDDAILATMSHVRNQNTHVAGLTVVLDSRAPSIELSRGAEAMGAKIKTLALPSEMHPSVRVGLMYQFIQRLVKEEDTTSNPAWVWLVDDDVWPQHNCLSELLRCPQHPVAMGAHVVDMIPRPVAFPPGASWKNEPSIGGPVITPMLSGSCLLVRSNEFKQVVMLSHDEHFGEDLVLTAQLSMIPDRYCWFVPSAKALHVRRADEEETWRKRPITFPELEMLLRTAGVPQERVNRLWKQAGVTIE